MLRNKSTFVLLVLVASVIAMVTFWTSSEQLQSFDAEQTAKSRVVSSVGEQSPATIAGLTISRDPTTGKLRAPTAAELNALNLGGLFDRSTAGLRSVQRADGSIGLYLQGRFLSSALGKLGPDGTVLAGCATKGSEAGAFFDNASKTGKEGRDVK